MFKNVASQKITLFVIDTANGIPKTGDAANLTAYERVDGGAVTTLTDTSATEIDATKAPGSYEFDLTQGETNGDNIVFTGKSTTANIYVVPMNVPTLPANFTAESIDSNGRVDVIKVAGTTQAAGDIFTLLGTVNTTTNTTSANVNTVSTNVNTISTNINTVSTNVNTISPNVNTVSTNLNAVSAVVNTINTNVSATPGLVWEVLLASHTNAGTTGKQLGDIATGSPPTAAAIANTVWEALLSAHANAGTYGFVVNTINTNVGTVSTNVNTVSTNVNTTSTNVNTVSTNLNSAFTTINTISTNVSATPGLVWEALLSAHINSGTYGLVVNTINSTASSINTTVGTINTTTGTINTNVSATPGLVWEIALASHTNAGTAGKKLGDLVAASTSDVANAVWTAVITEIASDADLRTNIGKMLRGLFERLFNKVTQTTTHQRVYKDDGATLVLDMGVSDDGTTQTKGQSS